MSKYTVTEHTPLETVVEVVLGAHAGRFGRLVKYGDGLCHVRLWSEDLRKWERGREYVGILRKHLRTTTYKQARERAELLACETSSPSSMDPALIAPSGKTSRGSSPPAG